MKYRLVNLTIIVLAFFLLFSCKTENHLIYMKDIDEKEAYSLVNNQPTIQPGDQLGILVSALDQDAVAPFNQNYSSSQPARYTLPRGNFIQQQGSTTTMPSYLVGTNEAINFPIVGEISVKGLTIEDLEQVMIEKLKKYIRNPSIEIRNLNYKITVLGEVSNPGTYLIPDGQATILSALGMAGDLTNFGERDDVLIVRRENDTIANYKIDLTSKELLNSPVYNLKQNDVIYVKPNKTVARRAKLNPNNGLYISLASLLLSLTVILTR